MKFSIKTLSLLMMCAVFFTSCFEIKEVVHFNKDGSGEFQFLLDMSSMKALIEMAQAMEEGEEGEEDEEAENPMAGATESFDEMVGQLEGIEGVSGAETISNEEDYIFGVKFKFKDIDALNDAMNVTFKGEDVTDLDRVFFEKKKKSIERVDVMSMKDQFAELMGGEGSEDMEMDPSALFADMKYTTVYSFDRKVKKVSNKNATISSDRKKVTIEQLLFSEDNEVELDNYIKLK